MCEKRTDGYRRHFKVNFRLKDDLQQLISQLAKANRSKMKTLTSLTLILPISQLHGSSTAIQQLIQQIRSRIEHIIPSDNITVLL